MSQGGKVRIGGEYLGGQKLSTVSQKEYEGLLTGLTIKMKLLMPEIQLLTTTLTLISQALMDREGQLLSGQTKPLTLWGQLMQTDS